MVGMEGPVTSASRMATFLPSRIALVARSAVVRDFPTPPLPDMTAITFLTFESAFIGAFSILRSAHAAPQEEQSCVQLLGFGSSAIRLPRFRHIIGKRKQEFILRA